MKKLSLFFFLTWILCSCNIGWTESEIRVQLHTQEALAPMYLGNVVSDGSQLPDSFIQKLEEIFYFDLSHNGFTTVVSPTMEYEKFLNQENLDTAFDYYYWKKTGLAYIVRPYIIHKQLNCFVYCVSTKKLKQFKDIALTGDLSLDRKLIHKLSDSIQKEIFGVMGVASSRILYSQQQDPHATNKWHAEIWECDWDGANQRQATHDGSYAITPVILPPHPYYGKDRFMYVSYKVGQPKIYQSSLKEKTGKQIVDLKGNQILPAISPKRDKIAFICDASGRADLFMQRISSDGQLIDKPVQIFSFPNSTQASPSFSPDGSKIAFVSDKDGSPRIYIISSTPGMKRADPRMITKQNRENICPSWSPDGTKLAYSAKTKDIRQIWIYDFETNEERQLTYGHGNKENPCWAPDSLHIVFNSTDPNSSELYIVNLNQAEAVRITRGPGKKHYPAWGTR